MADPGWLAHHLGTQSYINNTDTMKIKFIVLTILLMVFLTGCGNALIPPVPVTSTLSATIPPTSTATLIPSPTPTATLTPTVTPTPTPAWPVQGPGHVVCPILLYHRIDVPENPSRYFVTPDQFEVQMELLHDWGYTSIPLSLLVKAITQGAPLPPRPMVLTFDDGDISVYNNAWPVMKKYGYTGVVYIVSNRLQVDGYMNAEQIRALADDGWEVGSHSMSHADLTKSHSKDWNSLPSETKQSRLDLEAAIGVPVRTFAYPFGFMDDAVGRAVHNAGYESAVGLGYTADQWPGMLFYLWRREIKGDYTLKTFEVVMPWVGPPDAAITSPALPTGTLAPSP